MNCSLVHKSLDSRNESSIVKQSCIAEQTINLNKIMSICDLSAFLGFWKHVAFLKVHNLEYKVVLIFNLLWILSRNVLKESNFGQTVVYVWILFFFNLL